MDQQNKINKSGINNKYKIMKIRLNIKGKKIEIEVREMKGINKFLGLMIYRKDALFFNLENNAIHSLFCPRFLAIWLDSENKVIGHKMIEPWQFHIKPEKKFTKLIEIPVGKRYEEILKLLSFNS